MNKTPLKKGIKFLSYTLLCAFVGPTLLYQAFKNEGHPWFLFVLGLGLGISLLAILLGFRGIQQLIKGIFD